MLALISTWTGLITLVIAVTMLLYRPAFTDLTVTVVLWFGAPVSLCLAGLVLWAYRKEDPLDEGIGAQRLQAKVSVMMSLVAAAIVYALIIGSQKFEPIEPPVGSIYNVGVRETVATALASPR